MLFNDGHVRLIEALSRKGKVWSDAKSVLHIGGNRIDSFHNIQILYDSLGINSVPKTMHEFYENLGFEDIKILKQGEKCDLNQQWEIDHEYDLVFNAGTACEVFNQYNYFKQMHDACKVGGAMLHDTIFYNSVDNCKYNHQPNFFAKLAGANEYSVYGAWVASAVCMQNTPDFVPVTLRYENCNMAYVEESGCWKWKRPAHFAVICVKEVDEEFNGNV